MVEEADCERKKFHYTLPKSRIAFQVSWRLNATDAALPQAESQFASTLICCTEVLRHSSILITLAIRYSLELRGYEVFVTSDLTGLRHDNRHASLKVCGSSITVHWCGHRGCDR